MNVRELFRSKLENSEVIPSDSVRDQLMRRLAVKRFLRFSSYRFNIYYLGGITVAAVVSILLFTNNKPATITKNVSNKQEVILPPGSISFQEPQKEVSATKPAETISETNDNGGKIVQKNSELVTGSKGKDNTDKDKIRDSTAVEKDLLKKEAVSPDNLSGKKSTVGMQRKTEAVFDVSLSAGCSPLKVKFLNRSVSFDSCRWVFGDGGFSNEKNPEWIFDQDGEYKIVLRVFNSDGIQATSSTVIVVHPGPVARFETAPEKPVIPDDEIHFMNFSIDAIKYKWDFGDGNSSSNFEPDHKYRKYNNYNVSLIAWSEYGCTDTMLVKSAFSVSGCFINFPNAFIPGPDGPVGGYYSTKSDESSRIFHPVTSGVTEYHLMIFSKLGIIIFESKDINIGWDGYLKGQLCEPGVYIWKVRGTYKNGEPFVKMGDLTLLKN